MPDPVDGVYALEDWSNRWREGRAGWHLEGVHQMLSKYFASEIVQDRTDLKIFVPLCGKAKDLKWMHDQGIAMLSMRLSILQPSPILPPSKFSSKFSSILFFQPFFIRCQVIESSASNSMNWWSESCSMRRE